MLEDDSARVPFAAIGILLIMISTATSAYLMKMEATGTANSIEDGREGELNEALACARADVDNALNIACMYAEEEVGENPIVNVSGGGSPQEANMKRLQRMAGRRLSECLSANYQGGFYYGDYVVEASLEGDVTFETLKMSLARTVDHPIMQCNTTYAAYYVASAPVKLRVTRPGSSLDHSEAYVARALVTSRYPLLEQLTEEYEARLNGTAALADVTAASFAYTWARGYCQYFTGSPANIVDNEDLALISNAASMLEQGCVYNSVDPVSLASLARHTYDSSRSTADVLNDSGLSYINQYDFSNASRRSLQSDREPQEYRFNADEIVDKELRAAIADPVSRYQVDRAYSCRIHVTIQRKPMAEGHSDTGSVCKESYPLDANENGTGPFFRETWKVRENGTGSAELVTVDFIMDECSMLNGHDDVRSPHKEADFTSMGKNYVDSNLAGAVDAYDEALPIKRILSDPIGYPDGYSGSTREVTCEHNEWVEGASVTEIKALAAKIKGDVGVTLRPDDYGSYAEMVDAAYAKMQEQFLENYTSYLSEQDYRDGPVFKTCGAKYAFYKRQAFLLRIGAALNSSVNSSQEIGRKIDGRMKDYSSSMNSSTLNENARASRSMLDDTKMFMPFGLNMTLEGGEGKDDPYKWREDVALAIDQRPNYLGVDEYTDPETGYRVRPLKVRNVCLFALPTDFVDSSQATEAVLDGIDAVAGTAYRLASETVTMETSRLVEDVSISARQAMKDEINDALVHDQDLQGQLTGDDVESCVDEAFDSRTPEQAVSDMKNGTLQREMAESLARKARSQAGRELAKRTGQYVDCYGDYIEAKAEEAIMGAEEKALTSVVSALSDDIKQAFKDYMAEAASKDEDAAIGAALKRIPMGLPLLPPYGWWATMNVWYIEIYGEIPYLAVYDTDNEPVPDALLGQRATVYVRRPMLIHEGNDIAGRNEPIRFHHQTCTFIIVPPGAQGVGDKLGGWEEKSTGFDEASA
ncbi:DUF7286 family protein [Methanocella conradii]|uniref:DUF7286 family protein n=1 Tax=Methanocella conradii TaxID=1175444 RepID=UPI0024B35EEA|nr:hypothetical protein [Methanocella conradii]MDI6897734.1 hypothetical protein [Methanocella conradii]